MKKYLLFLITSQLLAIGAHAQVASRNGLSVGGRAGVNLSNAAGLDSDYNVNIIGMHAGIVLTSSFSWKHALQTEFIYSNKGFGISEKTVEAKYRLSYIDVPLLYRYNLTPKKKAVFKSKAYAKTFFIMAGPQVSALIGGDFEQTTNLGTETRTKEQNLMPYTKPFEFSVVGGLGYNITGNLMLNIRGIIGLSSLANSTKRVPENAKNVSAQLGLSYVIPVN